MARIAFNHLVSRLEASVGDFSHSQLLVVSLLGGDYRSVGNQREVDTRVRYQVGLEFRQVDIESAIEAQRGSNRRDDLADQSIQIGVRRAFDIEITAADWSKVPKINIK